MGKYLGLKLCKYRMMLLALILIALTVVTAPEVSADSSVNLVIDGKSVEASPKPFIKNGRTLVPVRIISEQLGAKVDWNEADRTVSISKDGRFVLLRIDSRLTEYDLDNEKTYNLSDTAPVIEGGRTFVPLRVVSNALGVGIDWVDASRTVVVDSSKSSAITPFFDMKILSVKSGQAITGETNLQAQLPAQLPKGAKEIKFLLIDPATAKGFVIGRGEDLSGTYKWLPSMEDNGYKVLVAAVYDAAGSFLAGESIPVNVSISPKITLTGVTENQIISADSVPLGANINFSPSYIKYEMVNMENGDVYLSPAVDPKGSFGMIPVMEDNGRMKLRVIAYDGSDNPYYGDTVTVNVSVQRKLSLGGASAGGTVDGAITLSASRNFNVSETEYVIRNPQDGTEIVLYKAGYGNYRWFPGPEYKGVKELYVRVKDTAGNSYTSAPVTVTITGAPKLLLQGVGPGQVITEAVTLKYSSNVVVDSVKYILTDTKTGASKTIGEGSEFEFQALNESAGSWKIKAVGTYDSDKKVESEEVKVTIYKDKIYSARPVIEKDKFMGMASGLAKETMKETGMSAALQTAQAILETGWGQSVPVDKYNGQFSYNLFGVKGTGTAGSVISNTWEEYNGVTYRIDDKFRAYGSIKESWADHNSLLLTAPRYGIYRDVMHDSTQGAWALRRAGYATDSSYSTKLIKIIKDYKLYELDRVGI